MYTHMYTIHVYLQTAQGGNRENARASSSPRPVAYSRLRISLLRFADSRFWEIPYGSRNSTL